MMRKLFFFTTFLIASNHVLAADKSSIDYVSINRVIVENIIIKDYASLASSSRLLSQQLTQLCRVSSDNNQTSKLTIKNLQQTFITLRQNWARVQLISFGPISFLERRERFDYWPDKHHVGERQLRKLLSQKGSLNFTPEQFREKSVAIQGLTALERLLFATGGNFESDRCELANLIATNLMNIATEVSSQWSQKPIEFKNDLLNPEADLTFFASRKEVTSVLLNDMSTQLRFLSDIKIANALPKKPKGSNKDSNEKGNFRKLESWRTGSSFLLMKSNLLSVENYYQQGFSEQMMQFKPNIHQQIMVLFKQTLDILDVLGLNLDSEQDQLLTKHENLDYLRHLQGMLLDIDKLFKKDIVSTFKLNIKFNALDGD